MQINSNRSQHYFYKIVEHCRNEQMLAYAREMLLQASLHEELNLAEIEYRLARPEELEMLRQMIVVAYNGRYASGGELISFGEVDTRPNVRTLLAIHTDRRGHQLPLATFRLVADELELFEFFKPQAGQKWPHVTRNLRPYETERLAYHALLAVEDLSNFQLVITRRLLDYARTLLDDQAWLGCTMSPRVAAFMDQVGLACVPLPVEFADNEQTRFMLSHWPHYFREVKAYEIQ